MVTETVSNSQSSKLRIIRPTDPIDVQHPTFHIYGGPGIGKTTLAFSMPKPILLNADSDSALARAANRRDALDILTIEEMSELLSHPEILDPFDSVIPDPVGGFVDLLGALIIEENPKLGRANGDLTQQGWGELKRRFRSWINSQKERKKNILLVSHNREDKASTDVVYNRPDITGGSKDIAMRSSDFVGFLYLSGKQRMIDFNPNEAYFAKNPRGLWKAMKVPSVEKAGDFMAKLFEEGRRELSKLSEASASVAEQAQAWRVRIQNLTTAAELNVILTDYRGLPPILEPQVRKILRTRAEELALDYDTTEKRFLEHIEQPAGGVL